MESELALLNSGHVSFFTPSPKPAQKQRRCCALAFTIVIGLATLPISVRGQTLTVLHSFKSGADGANPIVGIVRDAAGNLYGTTQFGGGSGCDGSGCGTVFKLRRTGQETSRYSLTGGADGSFPLAGVVRDTEGNLYGTAAAGATDFGTVFRLDAAGKETTLYTFAGGTDGAAPRGNLVLDTEGNLYGVTQEGGILECAIGSGNGCGTVFKLDGTTGAKTVLYGFTGGADGSLPFGGVMRDAAGNLYGTTTTGGDLSTCGGYGCGTVFKLDTTGKLAVLHRFTGGADGNTPYAAVIEDLAGNLYGTTWRGGNLSACSGFGCGTVFKLDVTGKETVLYTFTGGTDGSGPYYGALIRDDAGNLYGTTLRGGDLSACGGLGCGTVFKIDRTRKGTVLYSFTGGVDGANPYAGLIRDSAGHLYGTTNVGASGWGTVFEITP
jgi:uncharacterized repeat protein (TIGR03803 family)